MVPAFNTLLSSINYSLLTLFTLILAYAVSGLGKLIVAQYFSHLGELNCPPAPGYFWGHLQLLHDAENTNLYMKWMEQLGTVFTYRGFIGGLRLVTMDTSAITHILSLPHQYPKPSFVRDTLASMAGEQGLLVVEGEVHKRQRKILNPSFTASQVRELAPVFYDKAIKLRDIWLGHIDSAGTEPISQSNGPGLSNPRVPIPTPPVIRPVPYSWNPSKPSHKTLLSPATPTLPLTPSPQSVSPQSTSRFRNKATTVASSPRDSIFAVAQSTATRDITEQDIPSDQIRKFIDEPHASSIEGTPEFSGSEMRSSSPLSKRVRIDVLNWLGRATLDVIGLAGFGYAFDSLVDDQNDLAAAFAEVFSAARKFRFITVLQAWFPILQYFRAERKSTQRSLRTMRQIGMDLIGSAQERLARSGEAPIDFDFRDGSKKPCLDRDVSGEEMSGQVWQKARHMEALRGRDLLSLLIKSNMTTTSKDRMSQDEILSQISTFMAAGHETTSSALTWTLYGLSQYPEYQSRLRAEISAVDTPTPSPEVLNGLPFLDMVLRESLRLYSPVSQTMRVAAKDDIIPVAVPYQDAKGITRQNIIIKKGDIISIPIQAMNKSKSLFGQDAEKFNPERWERLPDSNAMPSLYSSILTFLYGGRACIGYRFALLEMKVFLFVLLRSVCFEACPDLVIEKRLNVVTRPLVKSEPERGNQMPLLLSRVASSPLGHTFSP